MKYVDHFNAKREAIWHAGAAVGLGAVAPVLQGLAWRYAATFLAIIFACFAGGWLETYWEKLRQQQRTLDEGPK